ncbi:hypothetical protein [Aequorivita echinoideorum]|uniref:Bacteriocin-type signal sequence-containing protein n=1 Tax=Aequorivita echinoideorum TaxID=1549647 RepID=A0ABS5S6L6_9FLAO|nr:hypothetical protein [Aequorivita echinoideorum]MBT0608858.1 hypothetical protein [Aequorivita echinoideorum]
MANTILQAELNQGRSYNNSNNTHGIDAGFVELNQARSCTGGGSAGFVVGVLLGATVCLLCALGAGLIGWGLGCGIGGGK